MRSRKARALFLTLLAGVAATAFSVAIGHGSSAPPSGLSVGVSALDHATAGTASAVDAIKQHDLSAFDEINATRLSTTPAAMAATWRELRTGLGDRSQQLFAQKVGKSYCFVLTGSGGTCAATDGDSSFAYTIGGGNGSDLPGALAGIVADDVTGIDLTVDGQNVPVSIANNAVYAQLPPNGRRTQITVVHADGSKTTNNLDLVDG